jgi:release factor glutamine methyltransferase
LDESQWQELNKYDIIVSNPPYIPLAEKSILDKNVTDYEPATALFVPTDQPLLFYEKIARFARKHLKNEGRIFMELHEQYAKQTAALFQHPYSKVEILTDISGKERILQVIY